MTERLAGFKGEYLWELEIAEHHLLALADALPAECYKWRPVGDARPVSAVIVHIAAGNFVLLDMAGVQLPLEIYPTPAQQGTERVYALIEQNQAFEKEVTAKADVLRMLKAAFAAWRTAFSEASNEDLERVGTFFGERTTVRRVYMRMLAHTHEHMGQLIAYVRTMGLRAPWPDPLHMK